MEGLATSIAGALGVALHDRMVENEWLCGNSHEITSTGEKALKLVGVDLEAIRRDVGSWRSDAWTGVSVAITLEAHLAPNC
jgi:hypothetical protein